MQLIGLRMVNLKPRIIVIEQGLPDACFHDWPDQGVWILSIPGFICVAIFLKWWAGLLLLVFATPMIFSANKLSAAQFVLEHAQENREFFDALVQEGILTFKVKN